MKALIYFKSLMLAISRGKLNVLVNNEHISVDLVEKLIKYVW